MAERAAHQVARQAFRQERVRLAVIGAIAALYAIANVVGYRDTYPTVAARVRFAAAFGDNPALRLLYGVPHDLATVAGYAEFRLVGLLSIVLGGWGVFAAVRALRGEEDAGRLEVVLANPLSRRAAAGAVLVALLLECVALWVALAVALLAVGAVPGDVSVVQSLAVAAAIVLPGALFVGIGGLAAQIASTHRGAQALGGAVLAVALLVRVLADLVAGLGGLRWATPLGWAELVRPVTGPSTAAVAVLLVATLAAGLMALLIADRRDVGRGLVQRRRGPRSRTLLLGTPAQAALRGEAPTLLVWVLMAGAFAGLIGGFSKRIADEARQSGLHPLGRTLTATGYLALTFVFFALIVALFAAAHIGSIREEESSGRLETLLALPVGRRAWFAERLAIAAVSTSALALLVGALAWVGVRIAGADVSAPSLLGAGANCIPAALLFLGAGALLFAAAPRQAGGGALGMVGAAFLWELVGDLVGAPGWLVGFSPFHEVAPVPERAFDASGAVGMLGLSALLVAAALAVFARRDLRTG